MNIPKITSLVRWTKPVKTVPEVIKNSSSAIEDLISKGGKVEEFLSIFKKEGKKNNLDFSFIPHSDGKSCLHDFDTHTIFNFSTRGLLREVIKIDPNNKTIAEYVPYKIINGKPMFFYKKLF